MPFDSRGKTEKVSAICSRQEVCGFSAKWLAFRQTELKGFCKISPLTCNQIGFDVGRATANRNFSKGNETAKPRMGSPFPHLGKSEFQRKFIWSVRQLPAPLSLASTLSGNSTRLSFDIGSVSWGEGGGGHCRWHNTQSTGFSSQYRKARARACVCVCVCVRAQVCALVCV